MLVAVIKAKYWCLHGQSALSNAEWVHASNPAPPFQATQYPGSDRDGFRLFNDTEHEAGLGKKAVVKAVTDHVKLHSKINRSEKEDILNHEALTL